VAAVTALIEVIFGAGEVPGILGVLAQAQKEAERVGRELLAGNEAGPEAAVVFNSAAGADYSEFADELALDGVDFAPEFGEGHKGGSWFSIYMDIQDEGLSEL